jgi:N-acetylglucosaminyldiphosphoundecaprenol N-acetyl-beta-D-mannosaminyltransferase
VVSVKHQVFNIKKFVKGIGVGFKILNGKYRNQLASGADLIVELVKIAKRDNKKIFLLGGWANRAQKSAKHFKSQFQISDEQIDWCAGEPDVSNIEVVKKINSFKPDILLVAYGMKKQEFWINTNISKLDVGIVMGVGRSFDYYSGELKRAPGWARKMGMEWLYSLIKEPKRLKRQLVLPQFILKVLNSN